MYTPKQFKASDEEVKQFIQKNGFATLVTQRDGQLWATHLPLMLSADQTKLEGHVSKGNKTWKHFEGDAEVMVVFQGPHTYVSSSWYNHENVPTWNYLAAHVYGTIKIIEGEDVVASLTKLTNKYEQHSEHPVRVEDMSAEYMRQHLQALVCFDISITRIEASFKLSQNRDAESYQSIIHELDKRGDQDSIAIAKEMKQKTW